MQAEVLHVLEVACATQLRKLSLSFAEIRQQVMEWDTRAIRRALAELVAAGWVTMVPNPLNSEIYRITPAGRRALAM